MAIWPGQRQRTSVQPDTSSSALWGAVGETAKAGMGLAVEIELKEQHGQYTDAEIGLGAIEAETAQRLAKETDPTKYDAINNEQFAKARALMPKNQAAANDYNELLARRKVLYDVTVQKAKSDKYSEQHEVKFDALVREGIITDNMGPAIKAGTTGWEIHGWDESQTRAILADAEHKGQKRQVENVALGPNPELFLENYKTADELVRDYPILTPGDFQDLRSSAISQQKYLEGKQVENSEVAEAGITSDIIKGERTPQEIQIDITDKLDKGIIDATQARTSIRFLESQMSNTGKEATQVEMVDATNKIYDALESGNEAEAMKLLREDAWMFTAGKNTTILQDIRNPPPETINNETYKLYSSAIKGLKTGGTFSGDTAKNINLSVKAQGLLRMFAKENPDANEDDYAKFFNKLIENQARWWAVLPGGRPWSILRRGKGEIRASMPMNIEAMQKELGTTETGDLSSLSDEELLKRIMGK